MSADRASTPGYAAKPHDPRCACAQCQKWARDVVRGVGASDAPQIKPESYGARPHASPCDCELCRQWARQVVAAVPDVPPKVFDWEKIESAGPSPWSRWLAAHGGASQLERDAGAAQIAADLSLTRQSRRWGPSQIHRAVAERERQRRKT